MNPVNKFLSILSLHIFSNSNLIKKEKVFIMADIATGSYSLSDIASVVRGTEANEGGMFGGGNSSWLILLLLFFMGGRGNGLFGGNGSDGITVQGATQDSVRDVLNNQSEAVILGAINGNKADISTLSASTNIGFREMSECCCATQRLIESTSAQTNLSICQLGNAITAGNAAIMNALNMNACQIRTDLLQQSAAIDKSICATNFNMAQGFANLTFLHEKNVATLLQSQSDQTATIINWLTNDKISNLQNSLLESNTEIARRMQTDAIVAAMRLNCGNSNCGTSNCGTSNCGCNSSC